MKVRGSECGQPWQWGHVVRHELNLLGRSDEFLTVRLLMSYTCVNASTVLAILGDIPVLEPRLPNHPTAQSSPHPRPPLINQGEAMITLRMLESQALGTERGTTGTFAVCPHRWVARSPTNKGRKVPCSRRLKLEWSR